LKKPFQSFVAKNSSKENINTANVRTFHSPFGRIPFTAQSDQPMCKVTTPQFQKTLSLLNNFTSSLIPSSQSSKEAKKLLKCASKQYSLAFSQLLEEFESKKVRMFSALYQKVREIAVFSDDFN
jgi:hypothetical protein